MLKVLVMIEQPTEQPDCYYTPSRVAFWLEHWGTLAELARPTVPAVQYPAPEIHGAIAVDRMRHVDTRADIERAWIGLKGRWSLEFLSVEFTIQGYPLREMERVYRLQHGMAYDAYRRACNQMARTLGWDGSDNPVSRI